MSRSQQQSVLTTGKNENATDNSNAQTSYGNAQTDANNAQQAEGNFEGELGKYSAANPYVNGGSFQTSENQQLTNTADAGSQQAGQAIQSAAVRTGQNPAGAIAATEAINQENTRVLGSQEGAATQQRLASGATYGKSVLDAAQQPATFESELAQQQGNLAQQQGSLAQGALGTEEQAAQTPSFEEELAGGLMGAGSSFAGGYGAGAGRPAGCWIAAELYGGWDDPRTTAVRHWIFYGPFSRTWYGALAGRLYLATGERLAALVRSHAWIRRPMRQLFDAILRRAVYTRTRNERRRHVTQ